MVFSFLAIILVFQGAILIFHFFQCFLKYFTSYSVCFTFSMIFTFSSYSRSYSVHFLFSVFLAIFQVKECLCLTFNVFFSFLALFQVLQCAFIFFQLFHCFSPYSMSYRVNFSFSTYFSVSRHFPGPPVCVSRFFTFFRFLAIFQVLQCAFLIFYVLQCFLPYSRS